jgi:hypothetical protein
MKLQGQIDFSTLAAFLEVPGLEVAYFNIPGSSGIILILIWLLCQVLNQE